MTGQTTFERFWAILASIGSSHPSVASQWESRKVSTSPRDTSAPRSLARTRPSLCGIRKTLTFSNWLTCSSRGFLRFSVWFSDKNTLVVKFLLNFYTQKMIYGECGWGRLSILEEDQPECFKSADLKLSQFPVLTMLFFFLIIATSLRLPCWLFLKAYFRFSLRRCKQFYA